MSENEAAGTVPSRRGLFIALGLFLAALVSRPWLGHSSFDAKNDACLYVLTARAIAEGEGYSYLGEPFTVRPPGFSLLIAPLVRFFGIDFGVLNTFVGFTGALSLVALFWFARKRLGDALALLIAVSLWLNPGYQASCNQVMSDIPGVALMLGVFLLARRGDDRPSLWIDVVLGLAIGAGALVRTAVLIALPAVLGARFTREALRVRGLPGRATWTSGIVVTLATIAALAPWQTRNASIELKPVAEHTFMHSYGTAMLRVDPGDANSERITYSDFEERVKERTPQVLATLGTRLARIQGTAPEQTFGVVLVLACIVQFVRRRRTSDFFAFGTTLVLCSYFAYRGRLAIPLYVLGLLALTELALDVAKPKLGSKATWLVGAGLLALTAFDAGPAPRRDAIRKEMEGLQAVARRLTAEVPPEQVVAASPHGYVVEVFLEDRSIFSLFPTIRRYGVDGVIDFVERREVDWLVLSPTHRTLCSALDCVFVADIGPWRIVRLRR